MIAKRWCQVCSRLPFSVGVIPSEIDRSLDCALPVIAELGLRAVELSEADGMQLPDMTPDIACAIADRLAQAGLVVPVAGTQIFKYTQIAQMGSSPLDHPFMCAEMDQLKNALRVANILGARILRLYAFRRDGVTGLGNPTPIEKDGGSVPDDIVDKAGTVLAAAGEVAQEMGVTLAVENVRSCWANSGINTARLVAAAAHPAVRICWDPANDFVAGGDPAHSGFQAITPYLVAAHLKSAQLVEPQTGLTAWSPIGEGAVDMATQIRLLTETGFRGLASIETHWKPANGTNIEGTRISFAGLVTAVEQVVCGEEGSQ